MSFIISFYTQSFYYSNWKHGVTELDGRALAAASQTWARMRTTSIAFA